MYLGQSRPSSSDSAVPDTAPTANKQAHHLGPPLGQRQVVRLPGPQIQPFDDDHQQRQADADRRKDHVKRQRHRHLQPCGGQGVHRWLPSRDVAEVARLRPCLLCLRPNSGEFGSGSRNC